MSYSIEQVKEMFKNCPICNLIQAIESNVLYCINCLPRFNYNYEEIYNDIEFKNDYIINLSYCIAEYDQANLICNVNFSMNYFTDIHRGNILTIKMQKEKIIKTGQFCY